MEWPFFLSARYGARKDFTVFWLIDSFLLTSHLSPLTFKFPCTRGTSTLNLIHQSFSHSWPNLNAADK